MDDLVILPTRYFLGVLRAGEVSALVGSMVLQIFASPTITGPEMEQRKGIQRNNEITKANHCFNEKLVLEETPSPCCFFFS